jgi:FkbM family methyltransferase
MAVRIDECVASGRDSDVSSLSVSDFEGTVVVIILRTKTKIALARAAQRVVMGGRRVIGRGPIAFCRRGGLRWKLDLSEGIDFSIFLLGGFERKMSAAYRRMIDAGAIVIDIGANIGAHTMPLATQVGPTGRVVAVEPTRYAFERLRTHINLNPTLTARILPLQAMLMGSRKAALAESVASSWPLDTPSGAHAGHAGVAKATTGAVVRTLDDLVSELDLKSVDFVKLDVDGYEVEVLRGARDTLRRFAPVIFFEHSPYGVAEKGYNSDEIGEILTAAGYSFADLKRRSLPSGRYKLPEVKTGAGVNLMALPEARYQDLLRA